MIKLISSEGPAINKIGFLSVGQDVYHIKGNLQKAKRTLTFQFRYHKYAYHNAGDPLQF